MSYNGEMTPEPQNGYYRIKTLATAGGVSTTLLRAWERRYGLFEPDRRGSAHRLYTEQDLIVIRKVRQLLDSGLKIGEIAALGRAALLKNFSSTRNHVGAPLELSELTPDLEKRLAKLAPSKLSCYRAVRFAGENLGVSLGQLHPADLATVFRLYGILSGVYEIWTYMEHRLAHELLVTHLSQLFVDGFSADLVALGAATNPQNPLVRAALEDAKGGALRVLLGFLQRYPCADLQSTQLRVVITLARDHAKMLRNAFVDLDEPLRRADETPNAHTLLPMLRKLAAFELSQGRFQAGSNFDKAVTSCCLETSALDRITYRFVCKALDPRKPGGAVWVTRLNEGLSRWAFQCSTESFAPFVEDDLPVQALAFAFGLEPGEVLRQGYLGTGRRGRQLWAWFHWPLYDPPRGTPQCHCEPIDH